MLKKTNKKGFTLIELIIVVAIMAVLVALLAPNVLKYLEKSKVGKDINSLDSVRLAVEAELMDDVLSTYSTQADDDDALEGVALSDLFTLGTAEGAANSTDLQTMLGYRLFNGDEEVLDAKFARVGSETDASQQVFSSKAAKAAHIVVFIEGNGGVAVAAVDADGLVSYDGSPIRVSTKLSETELATLEYVAAGDDE